jgi:hypothetical protein
VYVKTKGDNMNTKTLITRTTVTFIALALAGIFMAVGAKTMPDPVDQSILIAVGSGLLSGADLLTHRKITTGILFALSAGFSAGRAHTQEPPCSLPFQPASRLTRSLLSSA